jgi:hypothetical protein
MNLLLAMYSNLIGHVVDLPLKSLTHCSADFAAYIQIQQLHQLRLKGKLHPPCLLRNAVPLHPHFCVQAVVAN